MFYLTQSNNIHRLLDYLIIEYQQKNSNIFEPFVVIIPSKVIGEWLKNQLTEKTGICMLVETEFWGSYQWKLIQKVLKEFSHHSSSALKVPEVAVLSTSVMQWRIFGYLNQYKQQIFANPQHELYPLIEPILAKKSSNIENNQHITFLSNNLNINDIDDNAEEQQLWKIAYQISSMFNRYLTYRSEWLMSWTKNQPINIRKMLAEKDDFNNRMQGRVKEYAEYTPDWLIEEYIELEIAQRFLWYQLFSQIYQYRQEIEKQFWQVLVHQNQEIARACQNVLPKQINLFTIQQLPPKELNFIHKISAFCDVKLLHHNPSQLFWADIVDRQWLIQQRFVNPSSVYLKDYGHTLLSRFGKQSREVFAILAELSGNDDQQVIWQDDFIEKKQPKTLLAQLQQDILMLAEEDSQQKVENIVEAIYHKQYQPKRDWQINFLDNSLSINSCHSIIRQLEVLRSMLIGWFNYHDMPQLNVDKIPEENRRSLSDVLVLLPDIEMQQANIEAVFPKGEGVDGYELPAKVTGIVSKDINQLWSAIKGYFSLLNQPNARFEQSQVLDWLMLPPLYESYDLTYEQISRGCELLQMAKFIRGFDEKHLQKTLHHFDDDYRFTFAYALERLIAGLLMPKAEVANFGEYINHHGNLEKILPLTNVQLSDAPIIAVLADIYQTLHELRDLGKKTASAEEWLEKIEDFIHQKFSKYQQTSALRSIWNAQNSFKANIYANRRYQSFNKQLYQSSAIDIKPDKLPLKLNFILSSIESELTSQQVSAAPSGVITFGRIGALRNIPYKLIVMLDLNLNNFPNRETINRYNLMQAEIGKRGDRFKEDDDLGAFLDALLSAEESFWLFYNGSNINDNHEYLPASPIQELIEFLQGEISWQSEKKEIFGEHHKSQLIYEWLVTKHSALPFQPQEMVEKNTQYSNIFEKIKETKQPLYPLSKVWFSVYQELMNNQLNLNNSLEQFEIWSEDKLQLWLQNWENNKDLESQKISQTTYHFINLETVIRGVQYPAKTFIDRQQIQLTLSKEEITDIEKIDLEPLTRYQINQFMQLGILNKSEHKKTLDRLVYSQYLPAGTARYTSLETQKNQLNQNVQKFIQWLLDAQFPPNLGIEKIQFFQQGNKSFNQQLSEILTPCSEQKLVIDMINLQWLINDNEKPSDICEKYIISANLPNKESVLTKSWFNNLPKSSKSKYQVEFWLLHLCWQVVRQTTQEQVQQQDGFSLWQYNNQEIYYLPAIEKQQAYAYLQDWLMYWQLCQQTIMVLPPSIILQYLQEKYNNTKNEPKKFLDSWRPNHYQKFADYDNAQHETWQLLLKGKNITDSIKPFIQTIGEMLYHPLFLHLKKNQ